MAYQEFAKPTDRRCLKCRQTYRSDAPGVRYRTRAGQPRHVHPKCPKGDAPLKGWTKA